MSPSEDQNENEPGVRDLPELLGAVLRRSEDLVVLTRPDGTVVFCNESARGFLGDDLVGSRDRSELGEAAAALAAAAQEGGPLRWSGEVNVTGADGSVLAASVEVLAHQGEDGRLGFVSTVARDMSERVELHRRLEREATHDHLTGLPNRAMLFERIHDASSAVGSDPDHHVALLFIDLDHFKSINDSLGHHVGDQLLSAISRRVRTAVRPGDVVGRFGGDEFVVLCEGVESIDAATTVASRVESTLQAPFKVDGHDVHVGVSIGIAFANEAADAEALLRDADTAMYRAKSDGRGGWVLFDEDLRRTAVEREETLSALRTTRHGDDLQLHYQPVVELTTMSVVGVEALLRWERNGVLVTPDSFMHVAEETGLIASIGRWVIDEALGQLAALQSMEGWAELGMSVNVSARQLLDPGFTDAVGSALRASGVPPGSVAIELTETALVRDGVQAAAVLESLRSMGVVVAIDDFGTGYSSLTYLHALPVDVVKLDRSFVIGASTDPQKGAIVEAVVNLTAALGLAAVAEGIESDEHIEMLRGLGCVFGQGNHIRRPMSATELTEYLGSARGPLAQL